MYSGGFYGKSSMLALFVSSCLSGHSLPGDAPRKPTLGQAGGVSFLLHACWPLHSSMPPCSGVCWGMGKSRVAGLRHGGPPQPPPIIAGSPVLVKDGASLPEGHTQVFVLDGHF